MSITLHIERLVLDEALVASHRPEHIGAVVQAELERLLAVDGLAPELAAGAARARLFGGHVHFMSGAGVEEVGTRTGQAVHAALRSPGGERTGITVPPKG
jgi:hypothetical protein